MSASQLENLISSAVIALGYEFVGYEYVPQDKHALLRVYIDSKTGIGVDDCGKTSRQISAVLDVEESIKAAFTLEVSSPGLNRKLFSLAQFERFVGQTV